MDQFSILIDGPNYNFKGVFTGTEAEALQFIEEMNITGRISLFKQGFHNCEVLETVIQNFPSEELKYKWYMAKEAELKYHYEEKHQRMVKRLRGLVAEFSR